MKNRIAYALLTGTLVSGYAHAEPLKATQYDNFDRYVLALSWQSGFCQSMHERNRKLPAECREQDSPENGAQMLTVHGLWPGLPRTVAARGVDERRWIRYGCATRPIPDMAEVRASRKCAAPEVGLSDAMARKLGEVMPGAGGSSCLERYEFARHGACFGFNPDAYFGTMVRLTQEVRESDFGRFLSGHYGKIVSRKAFNEALARSWGQKSVKAVKLTCHGNPAYLTEMQIALKAKTINQPLSEQSFAPGPHSGNCSKTFRLDAAGF
ncbi:ribonuclease I [Erwinia sp. CPCC 100877]|nr:ribonuclease I [Erwinia sp. CPCC 100877]